LLAPLRRAAAKYNTFGEYVGPLYLGFQLPGTSRITSVETGDSPMSYEIVLLSRFNRCEPVAVFDGSKSRFSTDTRRAVVFRSRAKAERIATALRREFPGVAGDIEVDDDTAIVRGFFWGALLVAAITGAAVIVWMVW
jgi:hypothetical protein